MVSMVIGLVVIGAMFAAYVGTGVSSRNSRAQAQMTEDATIALNVLRSNIAATSYIVPSSAQSNATNGYRNAAANDGRAASLTGCSAPFTDESVAITALACDADGPDAIAVRYDADAANSALNAAGEPLDCLGNTVPAVAGVRSAYERFYVSNGSLYCYGPGANAGQALVDHVEDMVINYGIGGALGSGTEHQVVRYLDAAGIRAMVNSQATFDQVLSVRVCLTVASDGNVLDAVAPYMDCSGTQVTPTDKRMYRSYTTTVVLQNRLEARL